MWEQETLMEMFPNGYVPGTGIDVNTLVSENYEAAACEVSKMARNMLVKREEVTWYANGDVTRATLYDIQFNNMPEETCLSVYGNKMVQDWYQRSQYQRLQEVKTIQNAGFNYTGLQE